jgi:hypothetical protein
MNEHRFGRRFMIIQTDTSIFSPPLSPRTRKGTPYFLTASKNTSRTVDERILLLAQKPTVCQLICRCWKVTIWDRLTALQYPSTIPWITIPYLISLWWPSRCQRWLGLGTWYWSWSICLRRRRAVPRWLTRPIDLRIRVFWTRSPWDFKKPIT